MKRKHLHAYRNLRRKVWSLRSPSTGLVVGHAVAVELEGVTFRVQPALRQRQLDDGRRRVHAYVSGFVVRRGRQVGPRRGRWVRFTYNADRAATFTVADPKNPRPIHRAAVVRLDHDGAWCKDPVHVLPPRRR